MSGNLIETRDRREPCRILLLRVAGTQAERNLAAGVSCRPQLSHHVGNEEDILRPDTKGCGNTLVAAARNLVTERGIEKPGDEQRQIAGRRRFEQAALSQGATRRVDRDDKT